jgi:hypothetical protein
MADGLFAPSGAVGGASLFLPQVAAVAATGERGGTDVQGSRGNDNRQVTILAVADSILVRLPLRSPDG